MKTTAKSLLLAVAIASGSFAYGDYEDGVNAAQAGDYSTALAEFTVAAEEGLDLAQYNLAILYYTGRGVEQDFAQALRWSLAAAEQGHLNAQNNLGALYYTGTGTDIDLEAALKWYTAAAQGQHGAAQYNLATMYEEGEGTEQDYEEATELLARIEGKMTPEQLSQARRAFAQWQLE